MKEKSRVLKFLELSIKEDKKREKMREEEKNKIKPGKTNSPWL